MSAKATDQSVTDDQELAKVLANNTAQQQGDAKAATDEALSGLQFEESPVPSQGGTQTAPATPSEQTPPAQKSTDLPSITPSPSAAAASTGGGTMGSSTPDTAANTPAATAPAPTTTPTPSPSTSATTGGSLDTIKKDALEELRPLVDKLDLPAEEKFDTLLLIIRSTDDQSLLAPAHDAAKAITDESRRAQALLDIIKEIDYFSAQSK